MKQINILSKMLIVAILALAVGACSSSDFSDDNVESEPTVKHTVKMNFVGDVVGFDQQSSANKSKTRAMSSSWNDGDKIYLTFYNGSTTIPGEATYSSTSGWAVSYEGNLEVATDLKCEARYFVNATFTNSSLVTLNPQTEIYEDMNGSYSYYPGSGSLTVKATLSPKTGRIRFTGQNGDKIHITGITTYTTFAPGINAYTSSEAMVSTTVEATGSTPYIYGYVSSTERSMSIVGYNFAFNRTLTSGILDAGKSGYMAIPSESSHNNWRTGLYVKVRGVGIRMMPVAGMASGFFLMSETEVTQSLYKAVMNNETTDSSLPVSNISYSYALAFVEKLNEISKLNFDIPFAVQWKYAAMGGKNSQSYIYSGSDIPGDVAWYKANASSPQKVKSKTPNELGIYDMSGNVEEWVKKYAEQEEGSQYWYCCWARYGGSYASSVDEIKSSSYNYSRSSSYYNEKDAQNSSSYDDSSFSTAGIRLILKCD